MKKLINTESFIFHFLWLTLLAAGSLFIMISCENENLEIQQNFPFEVKVLPVREDIAFGQTAAIKMKIVRSGIYSGTQYYIRYFQYDGFGILKYKHGLFEFKPNDVYNLPEGEEEEIALYYTSKSTVSQSFDIWISDNFGNEKQLSFKFNNVD